jgi:hypothetical protein
MISSSSLSSVSHKSFPSSSSSPPELVLTRIARLIDSTSERRGRRKLGRLKQENDINTLDADLWFLYEYSGGHINSTKDQRQRLHLIDDLNCTPVLLGLLNWIKIESSNILMRRPSDDFLELNDSLSTSSSEEDILVERTRKQLRLGPSSPLSSPAQEEQSQLDYICTIALLVIRNLCREDDANVSTFAQLYGDLASILNLRQPEHKAVLGLLWSWGTKPIQGHNIVSVNGSDWINYFITSLSEKSRDQPQPLPITTKSALYEFEDELSQYAFNRIHTNLLRLKEVGNVEKFAYGALQVLLPHFSCVNACSKFSQLAATILRDTVDDTQETRTLVLLKILTKMNNADLDVLNGMAITFGKLLVNKSAKAQNRQQSIQGFEELIKRESTIRTSGTSTAKLVTSIRKSLAQFVDSTTEADLKSTAISLLGETALTEQVSAAVDLHLSRQFLLPGVSQVVAMSLDSRAKYLLLASVSDSAASLYHFPSRKLMWRTSHLSDHPDLIDITAVCFSPKCETYCCVGTARGFIFVLEVLTGRVIKSFQPYSSKGTNSENDESRVWFLSFVFEDDSAILVGQGNSAKVWDLFSTKAEMKHLLTCHRITKSGDARENNWFMSTEHIMSADGQHFTETKVRCFQIDRARGDGSSSGHIKGAVDLLKVLEVPTNNANNQASPIHAFSSFGRLCVVAPTNSNDSSIALLDRMHGIPLRNISFGASEDDSISTKDIESMYLVGPHRLIVSQGLANGRLFGIDLSTRKIFFERCPSPDQEDLVVSECVSADGSYVVVQTETNQATGEGSIEIHDLFYAHRERLVALMKTYGGKAIGNDVGRRIKRFLM